MNFPIEHYLLLIPLGFAVGTYGTLIGAGGGFALLPALLLLYPREEAHVITSISLAVVFFNALSGSVAYGRLGRIDFKSGVILASCTVPGAIGGVFVTGLIPRGVFDVILGILLLTAAAFISAFPLRERPDAVPRDRGFHRVVTERDGTRHEYSYNLPAAAGASGVIGFISSLLGIGGGIVHMPLLSKAFKFPVHVATATSHFVLAVMAFTATVINVANGSFPRGGWRTAFLAVGVLAGAQLGAFLSGRVKGGWIIRGLALALVVVGVRLLIRL
ncbi:MAG: sulfite exporter TauE/SafE family protein [Spirochaetales bacterium]|nr:sulfite exporter TauE/SafE family protein [Spirochaetales bacterium]